MAKQYKSLHPIKYFRDYLAHDIRPDGRELTKYRPVIINANSVSTAEGSAIAKVGKTTVICGIKAELCQPKTETPTQGFLIPNLELPPLCSSKFKPGPPSDQAQVATKVIADIIENSGCINLQDLCISTEKLAWCLYADLVCLDHDGSIIDACLLALFTALKTVSLPKVEYNAELDSKNLQMDERTPFKLYNVPVSTTFAILDETVLMIDPTAEEENLCTGVVTIVIKDDELCSVLKPGGSPITEEKLVDCIKQSMERAKLLGKLIDTATQETNDEIDK
ncbi:PREDICTED: exosome complex component RRP43-like [Nicrophorus vespilloides]|uniref:Ribosomal RNA-processing protein 43 n=1 Tax=Nicrophorus vespilloides TaxID=110193 RepID=A0ABM1MRH0_NICVS|nr:PREDICTED: exosome complex component RRP43-like [Nicrophorus vespilloides]